MLCIFCQKIIYNGKGITYNSYKLKGLSMNRVLLLRALGLFPHFLYKRITKKFNLNFKPSELDFLKVVNNKKLILENLFSNESELFTNYLNNSKCYGEYGVGISTVYAARYQNKKTISIDTDIAWVNKVKENLFSEDNIDISYVDFGEVLSYGRPKSYKNRENIKSYLNYIWQKNSKPDLVLIDGRFRVACFLTSLIHAEKGTHIIFDDYILRQHYHIVEIFEKPIEKNNRQAVFRVSKNYDFDQVNFYLNKFEFVFD